ncbi:type I methionyl aminopeptidase [Kocuria sp.]|uniref:type I methionyl aminopeptidase n=1 Tax=Kocuria sp. TaxID=1871328 RepID=UPI0026DF1EFD|nr:type I methionyl aminopeptidase [Kocuria sp.]MDO5618436.1 type I methionyl aminopeptidase [Kocuria sp.]
MSTSRTSATTTHNAPAQPGRAPVGRLTPGVLSPWRSVPAAITRPEYVGKAEADEGSDSNMYTPEEIERVRAAGRIAANALQEAGKACVPGTTTDELDRIAHDYMCDHGAYPSTLGYRGYPKSLCSSLNEVICHGIPDSTVLEDGDIINLDVTAYKDGMHGDTNAMFLVGDVDQESRLLVERTQEALNRAIKAVRPGRQINVIGRVIEKYARRFDYGVVRDFTGHGVGREFHSGLIIPHYDAAPGYSTEIRAGMIFTIEPMLTLGTIQWDQWDDDWTITTRDRQRTAQFEHTMVVAEDGAEILTQPDPA